MNKINIDKILPLVSRPARYINSEWNSREPKPGALVNVCLCFPDLYEVGGSNLGLEILYHSLNNLSDVTCERCYSPDTDLEELLRKNKIQLFSLESKNALRSFDIVGFTLQYELCATNILNMLDLAQIPFYSKDRDSSYPLIIGGGPVTANPEPYADFFDAFVIGDGEEAACDIIAEVQSSKLKVQSRKELLLGLAKIPGVYVPSFYDVEYNAGGTIKHVRPNRGGVPEKIVKRTVDINEAFFPADQIVPYIETVHNRLNIEIARGCFQGCRFCQAARYYSPYRSRSVEKVLELVDKGLKSTGYEDVSLSSLSCTDYKDIETLLDEINKRYGSGRISISLPSMRCDQFSLKVAGSLANNKRTSLTFAPEAGTDRLRSVIAKDLSETQIQNTLVLAWKMGWKLLKLYFMIGLPTETDADISGILSLVKSIKFQARALNLNVAISPFVPKPQTAFQWVAMEKEEVLKQRLEKLLKVLPASVKHSSIKNSFLEGVFARGDRRLSKAVVVAWQKGAKFDQWREKMKFEVWQQAFIEAGIEPENYLYRERKKDEVLPWDHIELSNKTALLAEYEKAIRVSTEFTLNNINNNAAASPSARNDNFSVIARREATKQSDIAQPPVQKLRLRFERTGDFRFISHLEQIEIFRRVIRRAQLPIAYTLGFHPQPKMSFGPAISVGYESASEFAELEFISKVIIDDTSKSINKFLPAGYRLISVKQVPVFFPTIESLCNMAEYEININVSQEEIDKFMSRPEITIEKIKKGKSTFIDAKPLIRKLALGNDKIALRLWFGPNKTLKPERIIQALCSLNDEQTKILRIKRTELFMEKNNGTVSSL